MLPIQSRKNRLTMALNRLSKRPGEVSSAQKLLPEETKDGKQLSDRELFKMMGYEGGK